MVFHISNLRCWFTSRGQPYAQDRKVFHGHHIRPPLREENFNPQKRSWKWPSLAKDEQYDLMTWMGTTKLNTSIAESLGIKNSGLLQVKVRTCSNKQSRNSRKFFFVAWKAREIKAPLQHGRWAWEKLNITCPTIRIPLRIVFSVPRGSGPPWQKFHPHYSRKGDLSLPNLWTDSLNESRNALYLPGLKNKLEISWMIRQG